MRLKYDNYRETCISLSSSKEHDASMALSACLGEISLKEINELTQETGIKTMPGKEMQKSKMAVWGGLTNSCEKKRSEKQRRKGKI